MTLVTASQQVRLSLNQGTTNVEPPFFLNCLGGRYLASQYRWHIGSWDDLDHFYHNLSQSAPVSEGLGCTQFVQQCATNRALVIDPTISPISLHNLRNIVDILYIYARNLHNGFRNHNCGFSTSCSKFSTIGTSSTICLFTLLKLFPKHLFRNCLHLRLTVWTQSPKIIILALMSATNPFQTC